MEETSGVVGVVGLGNMGGALAANLVAHGLEVVGFDAFAPERVPAGAVAAGDLPDLARRATTVVLSLPDGAVAEGVARQIAAVADGVVRTVVDTSTVGVSAAGTIAALLEKGGIGYVDAPVSGGVAGARARTLTVMYAGSDDDCAAAAPVLAGLSDRLRRVGDRPGLAQALKLANNFLSATALAATSEAVAFGTSVGLDMATMLEVLGTSSGQNRAVSDKFPQHVLTGTYASGFSNELMAKDVRLYRAEVEEQGGAATYGAVTADTWARFAAHEPGADFTRIYPFVSGEGHDPTEEDPVSTDTGDPVRILPVPLREWGPQMRVAMEALHVANPRHPYPVATPGRPKGLHILGTLAHHPVLMTAFHRFNGHVLFGSTLSVRDRELVVLRVAAVRRSHYEWAQHVVQGRDAGLTEAEIVRVGEGPSADGWSPRDRAMVAAVDELMGGATIAGPTFAALTGTFGFGAQQLLDLIFTIGNYEVLAMMLKSFGVQLDDDLARIAARGPHLPEPAEPSS